MFEWWLMLAYKCSTLEERNVVHVTSSHYSSVTELHPLNSLSEGEREREG